MITEAIKKIVDSQNLSETEMTEVTDEIMGGKATDSQIAAFITALRMKGETIEELTAAAKVMRKKVAAVNLSIENGSALLDTCGTGGDMKGTFNISTVSAFVIAGAGVKIAKHGNRSVSSKCGSADLIQALGVNIDVSTKKVAECIEEVGFGFLYAPKFHGAMKFAAIPRKEIGIRTIFNMIGPLTNPAMAEAQLLGVYDPKLTETFSVVLMNLGCKHALVVHGSDGLDEITITGNTKITELTGKEIKTYNIHPEDFGMESGSIADLQGGDIKENVRIARELLNGRKGTKRDVVLLNSAAGLIAAGKAKEMAQGIKISAESIDSGNAMAILQKLAKFTN